jgi:hypothetical protein
MWESMSPQQRQEWMAGTAAGKGTGQKDQYAAQLAENAKNIAAAYGKHSDEAKAAAQEYQEYIKLNSPGNRRAVQSLNFSQAANDILNGPGRQFMPFGGGGLAFGGQSNQRLQSVPMSFSEWKQRKQGR